MKWKIAEINAVQSTTLAPPTRAMAALEDTRSRRERRAIGAKVSRGEAKFAGRSLITGCSSLLVLLYRPTRPSRARHVYRKGQFGDVPILSLYSAVQFRGFPQYSQNLVQGPPVNTNGVVKRLFPILLRVRDEAILQEPRNPVLRAIFLKTSIVQTINIKSSIRLARTEMFPEADSREPLT